MHLGKATMQFASQVKSAVESLLNAHQLGRLPDAATLHWVHELGPKWKKKFVACGLLEAAVCLDLKSFLDYCESQQTTSYDTQNALKQAIRSMLKFWGEDRSISNITPGDVDEFRSYLHIRGHRNGGPLANATVTKRLNQSKNLFGLAVRKRWLLENPFSHLKGLSYENPERMFFVEKDVIEQIMPSLPDDEWRLILALARYAGLRTPSEVMLIEWGDFDWKAKTFRVRKDKRNRPRVMPIFKELRPYLERVDQSPGHVIKQHRLSNQAIANRIKRTATSLKIPLWPRFLQNLRSSRETELIDEGYPIHTVCRWIGNSPDIAMRHYLQIRAEVINRAADGKSDVKSDVDRAAGD